MSGQRTVKSNDKRKKLITLIHVGKAKLSITEEAYREMLVGICGKDSCAKMNIKELEQTLRAVKSGGFVVKSNAVKGFGKATPAQIKELKEVWQEKAKIKTTQAMDNFGKRITGVDSHLFYTVKDAQKVIIAVKALR